MITVVSSGSFKRTEAFLAKMSSRDLFKALNSYGERGVEALKAATPVDSGLTAASWAYRIKDVRGSYTIEWYNTNIENGVPVAILIQYGHGTGTGGWVQGRDYINPAIQPIFDKMAAELWRQVTNG